MMMFLCAQVMTRARRKRISANCAMLRVSCRGISVGIGPIVPGQIGRSRRAGGTRNPIQQGSVSDPTLSDPPVDFFRHGPVIARGAGLVRWTVCTEVLSSLKFILSDGKTGLFLRPQSPPGGVSFPAAGFRAFPD